MPLLPIVKWPDSRLTQPCVPVGVVDDDLRRLAADMLDTMYAAPGRGLAAPQVGVLRRLFVVDVAWKTGPCDPMVCVDPEILAVTDTTAAGTEGCLSIPGVTAQVTRATALRLRWTDLDGTPQEQAFDGAAAICIQHEYDHLDGLLVFDRLDADARAAYAEAYAAVQATALPQSTTDA